MRMLLATADPDLRLSLELLFDEQPGVQIVGTVSEGEGLQAIMQASQIHLIVVDWGLPGMPLPAVIADARQRQPSITTLVMVNSGEGLEPARDSGADAVVLKGTSPDHLLAVFRRLQNQIVSNQETGKYE